MVARRLDVAAGTVSAPLFRVPGDYGPSSEGFTPDGRGIYVVRLEKTGEGKPRLAYAVADARTGALTPLAGPPEPAPPAASPHVSSKGVIARTVGGRFTGLTDIGEPDGSAPAAPDTRLQAVYLESLAGAGAGIPEASRRALVAADAGGVMLLPDGSALLYMSRGSLFVCPLRRRPRAPAPAAQVQ